MNRRSLIVMLYINKQTSETMRSPFVRISLDVSPSSVGRNFVFCNCYYVYVSTFNTYALFCLASQFSPLHFTLSAPNYIILAAVSLRLNESNHKWPVGQANR